MNTENIMAGGLLVGVLAMLFYTPYCLAAGIDRLNGNGAGFKPKCCIPIVNTISAEVNYFGKMGFLSFTTLGFILSVVLKVCTWLFMHSNTTVNLITTFLVIGLFALLYIANCWFVYIVIHDADILGMAKLLMFTIIFPIGQWYIKNGVAVVVEKRKYKEDTFKK